LFSDAHPFSDTDDRERTGPTPQYRGLGRLNSLKLRSLRIGCFDAISAATRNSLKLHDTNRDETQQDADIFPVIGPLMDPQR
jgi:hypothetical protein